MKNIFLMSLYQPQPCLQAKPCMIIQQVENQMEKRLTMTMGNVNFSDYWFAMIDASINLQGKYIGQHFSLLTDDESWKQGQTVFENFEAAAAGKSYIGVALVKIRSAIHMPLDKAQELIEKTMEERRTCGKLYRTFDNADFIILVLGESREQIKESVKLLKTICSEREFIYYSFYSLAGKLIKKEETDEGGTTGKSFKVIDIKWFKNYLRGNQNLEQETLCKDIMDVLRKKIERCTKNRDVKWISYYQALYQIVNLMSQYEEKDKYKDLYYIFFPTLQLFIKQLDAGMDKLHAGFTELDKKTQSSSKHLLMRKMENAISDFIDSMEVLIYHIGVSCANILNVEGRNGLPYDISIRLCMMYMSSLHMIEEVLNDTECQYEFCLVPLAYSRPRTNILDFGLEPGDRLIRVQISKQQMLSPRALLAILAHEGSHYIGNFRKRNIRADCFTSMAAILLLEELLPLSWLKELENKCQLNDTEKKIFCYDYCQRKERLVKYLKERLAMELRSRNQERKQKYHLTDISKDVIDSIELIFQVDYQRDLISTMDIVTDEMKEALYWNDCSENLLSAYEQEVEQFNDNLRNVVTLSNVLEKLSQIQNNLKEIVADLGAILILQLEPCYYLETFLLSESYVPDSDSVSEALINRIAVVKQLMCQKHIKWKADWNALTKERFNGISFPWELKRNVDSYIAGFESAKASTEDMSIGTKEDLTKRVYGDSPFQIKQIVDLENYYLDECYKELAKRLEKNETERPLQLLRSIYRHFRVYKVGEEPGFYEFFADLKALTDYYKESVKKKNRNAGE